MIETWDGFITFLTEARDCELYDNTDWAFPIYRCRTTGRLCGLDTNAEIDDTLICGVCHELAIDPPDHHI